MGNSAGAGHRVLGHGDYPCSKPLSKYVTLDFGGREVDHLGDYGEIMEETWPLSLIVDGSSCNFYVTRTKGIKLDGFHRDRLEVIVKDNTCRRVSDNIFVTIRRDEAGLLHFFFTPKYSNDPSLRIVSNKTTTNTIDGVTETTFHLGDRGSKGGFFVREEKKKRRIEKPYTVNLWYYFAVRPGKFSRAKFGYSVAIKRIRVARNGRLEFDLEGPKQHPSDDLFFMFDKVIRTQTWKPSYCPHCCDECIQRQSGPLHKSESESDSESESESEGEDNDFGLHGGRPNGGQALLDNGGKFLGHNNGNLNVTKLVISKEYIFNL